MDLNRIIKKFFLEDNKKILKWGSTKKEKLFEIESRYKDIKLLPYMTNLYVIDDEGYFRGFVNFSEDDSVIPDPTFIFDNKGKVILRYLRGYVPKRRDFIWETFDKKIIEKENVIKYLLNNSKQIKEDLFKIKA